MWFVKLCYRIGHAFSKHTYIWSQPKLGQFCWMCYCGKRVKEEPPIWK